MAAQGSYYTSVFLIYRILNAEGQASHRQAVVPIMLN